MCGICGILSHHPDSKIDEETLAKMNSTLVHRGPDDDGFYAKGPVGLAMRRLSIIDLKSGKQPIHNEDQTCWIVFNGEIYNYRELRENLITKGHQFRTNTDTEVILHLYEDLGEACLERLNGMFAFAIWDAKRRQLFLARDPLGIKPLFYALSPSEDFFFASEIKAILQTSVDKSPDHQGLYDYLSLMYVPTPATAFKQIRKLPPGHYLIKSFNNCSVKQYWDVPLPRITDITDEKYDYESELQGLLQEAVQRHMIADVQVGSLLSGGLDSTTVTAIMAKVLKTKVKTFTIGFEQKSYDESAEARLVANTLNTDHLEKIVYPGMIDSIPELLLSFDEPFADYSAIPTYLVAKTASQYLKVVLTGDGGDEIFAGYPTHVAYRVADLYRKVPSFIRKRIIRPLVQSLPTSMERISFDYKAKRFVMGAELSFEEAHYSWKVIFDEDKKQELVNPDFSYGLHDSFEVFQSHFDQCKHAHALNRLLYVDIKTFLLDDNLTKVDRMTMANSLEARVPLLDRELVERVATIPPEIKSSGLETKGLLRRSVSKLLPPQIRKGKKKGFTPPLPIWLNRELKPFILDVFNSQRIKNSNMLNSKYISKMVQDHFSGKVDNNREIWTLVTLLVWLEKHPIT